MSDADENGRYEGDEDERRDAYEARHARNAWRCRCPDMRDVPGHCPGPDQCPLQEHDEEEMHE